MTPTVTVRGKTYTMNPISDVRWIQMRGSFERTFERSEAEYAIRYPPLIRQPVPSQYPESWGT